MVKTLSNKNGKTGKQKGTALVEIIVSIALLGIIGAAFFQGSTGSAHARVQADERASAKIIAESVIDTVKKMDYSSSYSVNVSGEYPGYAAEITAEYLDGNALQKITVVVSHYNRQVLTLQNYKVNR